LELGRGYNRGYLVFISLEETLFFLEKFSGRLFSFQLFRGLAPNSRLSQRLYFCWYFQPLFNLKSKLEFEYSLEGIDLKDILTQSNFASRGQPIYGELTQGNQKASALIDNHCALEFQAVTGKTLFVFLNQAFIGKTVITIIPDNDMIKHLKLHHQGSNH